MSGYLAEEKAEIAKTFLLPKQLREHGIDAKALKISAAGIKAIIDQYTHESGVRGLEKQIAKIARVTAKKIALEQEYPSVIKPEHLKEYLGLPTNFHDQQKGNEAPGVVTGLAWTQMGGEILFVESSVTRHGQDGFEDLLREGYSRARARRGYSQGRPVSRYNHGEFYGVGPARRACQEGDSDDRRDDPSRKGAPRGWH